MPQQRLSLNIAVAILRRQDRFLVANRPKGSHLEHRWEFPGGKIRAGETPQEAVRREAQEEVDVAILEEVLLHTEEHDYGDRSVRLHFFLAIEFEGTAAGREGQEIRWVTLEELRGLEFPPANRNVIELLGEHFEEGP